MSTTLYTGTGAQINLAKQLGRGGEGAVFDVSHKPDQVAKIYHKLPDPKKQQKLRFMAESADQQLLSTVAWPQETLHKQPGGPVIGFIMPKIGAGEPIHLIYNPAHRRKDYPNLTWSFLLYAARNVAAAFAAIHEHGHVIGDVNQNSFIVNPDSRVTLIDADSFQINARGTLHYCEVGVSHFTSPELQSIKSFAGFERTPNHDAFGMALLIFHLLFGGRHPYSGVPLRDEAGKSLESDIAAFRYAYSRDGTQRGFSPPPRSIPIALMPASVMTMFEFAFTESGVRQSRPQARDWMTALDGVRASLKTCGASNMHVFPDHLRNCPWCELERVGVMFFVAVPHGTPAGASKFVLADVWRAIDAIRLPPEIRTPTPPSNAVGKPMPPIPPVPTPVHPAPVASPPAKPATPQETQVYVTSAPSERTHGIRIVNALIRANATVDVFGLPLPFADRDQMINLTLGVVGVSVVAAIGAPWYVSVVFLALFCVYVFRRSRLIDAEDEKIREAEALIRARWQTIETKRHETREQAEKAERERLQKLHDDERDRIATITALRENIIRTELQSRQAQHAQALQTYNTRMTAGTNELAVLRDQYKKQRAQLDEARSKYEEVAEQENDAIDDLKTRAYEHQLERHLRSCFVDTANIPGIGPGRKASLLSFGIQTAADVTYWAVSAIPGFGDTYTQKLLIWRNVCEQLFRFDPNRAINPTDIATIRHTYAQARATHQNTLTQGAPRLTSLRDRIATRQTKIHAEISTAANALAEAEADLRIAQATN